ncbi:MAG: DUF1674 domain-containing protein [Filomicrobium sp.]
MGVADAGQAGLDGDGNNAESALTNEADESPTRSLTPAAERALAEAAERRKAAADAEKAKDSEKELGGQRGPEPTRFGDWEKGGIISDF